MTRSATTMTDPETRLATGIFPLPFLQLHWDEPELNEAFRDEALARRSAVGIILSNRGGWHSDKDLLTWPGEQVRRLEAMILEGVGRYAALLDPPVHAPEASDWVIEAWMNVNPAGAWNDPHTHTIRGNAISGVYYVRVPDRPVDTSAEGAIVFEDHSGAPMSADYRNASGTPHREFTLQPAEGDMALFPSWLRHRVRAHQSEEPRISIAFNARHPAIAVPRYPDMITPNWRWRNFAGVMKVITWIERKVRRILPSGESVDNRH